MSETLEPRPRAGVMQIEAYVPGKSTVPAGVTLHKLSANENPLGPSPKAVEAVRDAAARMAIYPDGSALRLRQAIGETFALNPANIVCSNGSDEILALLTQVYLAPGDEAVITAHAFMVYKIYVQGAGGVPVIVPEHDERADVDTMLAAVTGKTRIVFLANPNNPTGTYLPFDEVRRLHAALPHSVLLVLDAAYAEYVRKNDYEAGIELVSSSRNVVMTRTFSKLGLGGIRLGWMFGPDHVVDAVNRTRSPFNVNSAAIEAGIAAVRDRAHVERSVEHNTRWLDWLTEEFTRLGLRVTPSVGNFLLVHFDGAKRTAAEADAYLTAHGYVLRAVAGYGFPNALRMSIGLEDENRAVAALIAELLAS